MMIRSIRKKMVIKVVIENVTGLNDDVMLVARGCHDII